MMKLLVLCFAAVAAANNVAQVFLEKHYECRAGAGQGPVKWDGGIAASAAQTVASCQFAHSDNTDNGENIAMGYYADPAEAAEAAVDMWCAEKPYYNYARNSCTPGKMCGHYTQIVWASSTNIGCAVKACGVTDWGIKFITACQYYPPGNWMGTQPY